MIPVSHRAKETDSASRAAMVRRHAAIRDPRRETSVVVGSGLGSPCVAMPGQAGISCRMCRAHSGLG